MLFVEKTSPKSDGVDHNGQTAAATCQKATRCVAPKSRSLLRRYFAQLFHHDCASLGAYESLEMRVEVGDVPADFRAHNWLAPCLFFPR
jgi:hypothetical protein